MHSVRVVTQYNHLKRTNIRLEAERRKRYKCDELNSDILVMVNRMNKDEI